MNKVYKALVHIPCGVCKIAFAKIFHPKTFKGSLKSAISPLTEITLERGGYLNIGKGFKMRDGAKIRVRKGAKCTIGKNVLLNSGNIITCHDNIVIGDNVQLSPGVLIYDHDHDFRAEGGLSAMKYRSSPIVIGNNVWIGANTVILRGTVIGDNSVIAAGSVLKGNLPADTVIYQKRENSYKSINV